MTVFDPVDASSTYEETVARLGTAIRIGVLEPGSKLPPERELAEQLDISRSTLRQALATLTGTGHLSAVRGRLGGTFVSENPPIASGSARACEEWRTLLDWRLALELGVVQLAAERAYGEDHERLAAAYDALEQAATTDYAAWRRADVAFHLTLAEVSRSRRLIAEMTQLHGELTDLMHGLEWPEEAFEQAGAEHGRVLDAVRDGDAARAVTAMRRHLGTTEQLVAETFELAERPGRVA